MKTKSMVLVAGTLGLGLTAFGAADKFVAAGWEFAGKDVDYLLQRADAYDKTPLSGCILYLEAKGRDGLRLTSRNIIHQRAWDYAEFEPLVPKYRELLSHKAFRHSFLNSYRAPTNRVAWTDDATWAKVANQMRVTARFAKACGFEGLQMDPEDYHRQFQYVRRSTDGLSYDELSRLARQRGREVFGAVFEEFPDVRILSYWFLTMNPEYAGRIPPKLMRAFMIRNGRDLWPHFVDGIFDVLPKTATLIEGCEHAYSWKAARAQYLRGAIHVREDLPNLLSPENREKYQTRLQMSFGVYLDGYSVITNGLWYMPPVEGSRLRHLSDNLDQARFAASEYIWFWGEKRSWIGADSWESVLPGLDAMLRGKGADPAVLGRTLREEMEAGRRKSVKPNGACVGTDESKVPAPYTGWQEPPKYKLRQGTFGCDLKVGDGDSSSLVATGVESGCFTLAVDGRRTGETFGLSFSSRGEHLDATIGWRKDGVWDWSIPRDIVPITGTPDANGWTRTDWSFSIPEGANGFAVLFGVKQDAGEKCWFDNISVIPAEGE